MRATATKHDGLNVSIIYQNKTILFIAPKIIHLLE
jgi:hypothetical protein